MPRRKLPLITNEYYHVFNRGTAQMQIFNNKLDYKKFLNSALYYQLKGPKPRYSLFTPNNTVLDTSKKIVDIVCYCLMPNHFHFLLRQITDGGISEFISKLSNSYTKYFNIKNNRIGPLLQGEFKAVHIGTNEQLLHVSRYIHLNPLVGYLVRDLERYEWSSYNEYSEIVHISYCSKEIILSQFKDRTAYLQFLQDQVDYGKKLESIKHQALDYPEVQT